VFLRCQIKFTDSSQWLVIVFSDEKAQVKEVIVKAGMECCNWDHVFVEIFK
jgi:hypothetical protein